MDTSIPILTAIITGFVGCFAWIYKKTRRKKFHCLCNTDDEDCVLGISLKSKKKNHTHTQPEPEPAEVLTSSGNSSGGAKRAETAEATPN